MALGDLVSVDVARQMNSDPVLVIQHGQQVYRFPFHELQLKELASKILGQN